MGGRCSSYSAAADCIDRSTSGLCVIFWEIQKQQMRFDERVTSTQANQTTHFKIFCCPSSFILQQFGIVERVLWVVSCMFMHMYSESYLQHEIYDIYCNYIVTICHIISTLLPLGTRTRLNVENANVDAVTIAMSRKERVPVLRRCFKALCGITQKKGILRLSTSPSVVGSSQA